MELLLKLVDLAALGGNGVVSLDQHPLMVVIVRACLSEPSSEVLQSIIPLLDAFSESPVGDPESGNPPHHSALSLDTASESSAGSP